MGTNSTEFPTSPSSQLFCSRCGAQVSSSDKFCPTCAAPQSGSVPRASYVHSRTYAGFWIRVVAYFIDAVIVGIALSPITILSGLTFGVLPGHRPDFVVGAMMSVMGMAFLLSSVIAWLYEALMTSSPKQATLGKMALGLVVTDANGARLTFLHATARHFAKYISGMLMGVGYMMAGFTERKQALHDFICGTFVLKGPPSQVL